MKRRAVAIALMAASCGGAALGETDDFDADALIDSLDAARHLYDALARAAARLPMPDRIVYTNILVNRRIAYVDDTALGGNDVWQTPIESLASGRGDCEDIAIAKFFLLLAAGVEPRAVRLLYARWRDESVPGVETPHVVAVARDPFDDPFVLDNLNLIVLPLSQRGDLAPVFSFDQTDLWRGVTGARQGDAAKRLPAWRNVLARLSGQMD